MLKLSLCPNEYLTINGDIVVQVYKVSGKRVYMAIEADKDIPIVRGTLLEEAGASKPECLSKMSKQRKIGNAEN